MIPINESMVGIKFHILCTTPIFFYKQLFFQNRAEKLLIFLPKSARKLLSSCLIFYIKIGLKVAYFFAQTRPKKVAYFLVRIGPKKLPNFLPKIGPKKLLNLFLKIGLKNKSCVIFPKIGLKRKVA
jgi:hypothetical protein